MTKIGRKQNRLNPTNRIRPQTKLIIFPRFIAYLVPIAFYSQICFLKIKYILLLTVVLAVSIGCNKNEDNSSDPEIIIEIVDDFINTKISEKALDVNSNLMRADDIQINSFHLRDE